MVPQSQLRRTARENSVPARADNVPARLGNGVLSGFDGVFGARKGGRNVWDVAEGCGNVAGVQGIVRETPSAKPNAGVAATVRSRVYWRSQADCARTSPATSRLAATGLRPGRDASPWIPEGSRTLAGDNIPGKARAVRLTHPGRGAGIGRAFGDAGHFHRPSGAAMFPSRYSGDVIPG